MSNPELPLLDWASLALQSYHLRRPVVRLLGQSENITFHVREEESNEPFPADGGPSAETAATALGQLLATLHQHASTWDVPPDCVRPAYDGAFFQQVAANLAPGVAAGIIAPAVYERIQQTLAVSGVVLDALPRPAQAGA